MKNSFLLLLWVSGAAPSPAKDKPPAFYTLPLPPQTDFSAFEWLMGDWKGATTEYSPQGEVHFAAEATLGKKFILLHEEISFAATKSAPATRESWMGILRGSRTEGKFLLAIYSSTGFITRYRVSVDGPRIHFDPEGGDEPPPGWLFRRVLERSGDAELLEKVQVAPPDRAFFDYYTAKLTRAAIATPAPK